MRDEAGLPLYGGPGRGCPIGSDCHGMTTLARAAHVRDLKSGTVGARVAR